MPLLNEKFSIASRRRLQRLGRKRRRRDKDVTFGRETR